jgi:UDP-2,3-diacylglucosamine pyrophosphatase LpxH
MADSSDDAGLPAFAELRAPPLWQAIDFLSDLHLSQSTPRTFEALATHLRCTDADAVLVLGDLFEVWVGDDARHDGFEAECAAMLAEASAHRFIGFMAGNRDFLVGADMLRHCGVVRLADPTVLVAFGQRTLLTHGDALCLSDVDYQAFRAQVRDPAWQRQFLAMPLMHSEAIADQQLALKLYAALGPRYGWPFARSHYRMIARFGRFPHRNEILGRVSTPEERDFLTQPHSSF